MKIGVIVYVTGKKEGLIDMIDPEEAVGRLNINADRIEVVWV